MGILSPLRADEGGRRQPRNFYMDVRTNMLVDALAVPNIAAGFYLGKNWSIDAGYMHAWWTFNQGHRWRIYGGEIGLRRWFGKTAAAKPLSGHHVGVYGQAFTYDFRLGDTGYMGGSPGGRIWDKMNYVVGADYGYSLPVARRLNIDFTIGVGYWGGEYYEYRRIDGHSVWQRTRRRHWFGPTKAEISLVWLIGRGNTNKKGGQR